MFPVKDKLSIDTLKPDLIAGVTVALVLIPQSLAYAQLAGLPIIFGLYASLLPPFIAAFFGSSKHLSTGPVAILSVMTAAALTPHAVLGSEEYIGLALLLALCLGIFQLLLGIFKLGGLVSFLSHPVVYGFTNASALIIASTQLPKFFGVTIGTYDHQYQSVVATFIEASHGFEYHTYFFGMAVLLTMFLLKKINKKMPVILIVVVASILVSYLSGYDGAVIGNIPTGLPVFTMPKINFGVITSLSLSIVTMSLIGFTESISIAQAIAVKTKTKVNPNQELVGQGIANMIGAFFQSYPIAGSFSRTAVNYQAGAQTKLASFVTSAVVLLVLLFFTQFLYYLPTVVLASIIIYSVTGLIDFKKIKHIWQNNRFDAFAAVLTFFGTLIAAPHLEKGVLLGVVFSLGHYVYRNAHPKVVFMSKYKDGSYHDASRFNLERCENIAIVRLDAPLFFANSAYFEEEIISHLAQNKHIKFVLIVGSGINEIDSSGEEMLASMFDALKAARKDLYFSDMKEHVYDVFVRTGLVEKLGQDHFFKSTKEGIRHIINDLEHKDLHKDEEACPLEKYIESRDQQRHVTKDKRDKIAYFYRKLMRAQL